MHLIQRGNERVKRFTIFDMMLVKLAVFAATVVIIKLFPDLLNVRGLVYLIIAIVCSIKPFITFWHA